MALFSIVAQRTLSDIRETNKSYVVRKMADGNCWMSDNLKFELQANKTYTGVNNTTGEPITFSTGNACNAPGPCIINGSTAYDGTYDSWYYSWYAATAGSGTESMANQDAPYSICPAHWRLPTNYTNTSYPSGGADKSWGYLLNDYGISPNNHDSDAEYKTLEAFPFSLPRAGWFAIGTLQDNRVGNLWSATAYNIADSAYHLSFSTVIVRPQRYSNKPQGFNIRCVAL